MRRSITFYSEGFKLDGDLFLADDLRSGERRGRIVLAHGYTGGARWMRSVRRPDEWHELLARARADREKRVIDG